MQDGHARALEDPRERGDVDREGVDEGDPALPGELKQGEMGEIGPLPVELGVEGVDLAGGKLVQERLESRRVPDPAVVTHPRRSPHDRARAAHGAAYPGRRESLGTRAVASLRAPETGTRGSAAPVPHVIVSVLAALSAVAHAGVLHAKNGHLLAAGRETGVEDLSDKQRVRAEIEDRGAGRSPSSRWRTRGWARRCKPVPVGEAGKGVRRRVVLGGLDELAHDFLVVTGDERDREQPPSTMRPWVKAVFSTDTATCLGSTETCMTQFNVMRFRRSPALLPSTYRPVGSFHSTRRRNRSYSTGSACRDTGRPEHRGCSQSNGSLPAGLRRAAPGTERRGRAQLHPVGRQAPRRPLEGGDAAWQWSAGPRDLSSRRGSWPGAHSAPALAKSW